MKRVRPKSADYLGEANVLGAAEMHGETKEMLQQLAKDICNLVFMDIEIPGMSAFEAASIVKAAYPEINVVLLTVNDEMQSVENIAPPSLEEELETMPPVSISAFISRVYEAAIHTNMVAVNKVLAFFNHRLEESTKNGYGLTSRELEILRCLVSGDTYKKIASHCHISVGTVRSHIMNIYRKLDVNSRSNAIVKAMKEHLVTS
jgi:DNA-binding NarL/FixJ family response regulator